MKPVVRTRRAESTVKPGPSVRAPRLILKEATTLNTRMEVELKDEIALASASLGWKRSAFVRTACINLLRELRQNGKLTIQPT